MNKRQRVFSGCSGVRAGVGAAAAAALGLLLLGCSTGTAWEAKRDEALNRPREVIYNNDGNEPYLWPTNQPFSIAAFLDMRTTPVLGSQVDSVYYCPVSSGFGFLTAHIPSADLMLRDLGTVEHLAGKKNVLQEFLDVGTDPVREVVSWCRTNGFEVFVTLRVNDTHDQGTDQTKVEPPYAYPGNALFSPFKIRHPESRRACQQAEPQQERERNQHIEDVAVFEHTAQLGSARLGPTGVVWRRLESRRSTVFSCARPSSTRGPGRLTALRSDTV